MAALQTDRFVERVEANGARQHARALAVIDVGVRVLVVVVLVVVQVPVRSLQAPLHHPRHRPELQDEGREEHLVLAVGPVPAQGLPSLGTVVGLVPFLKNFAQRGGVELDPVDALLRLVFQIDVHPGEVEGVIFSLLIPRRGEAEAGVDLLALRTVHPGAAVNRVQVQALPPPRLAVLKRSARQDPAHPREVRLGGGLHGLVELGVEQLGATLARRVVLLRCAVVLRRGFLPDGVLRRGVAVVAEEGCLLLRVGPLQRGVLLLLLNAVHVASAVAEFL